MNYKTYDIFPVPICKIKFHRKINKDETEFIKLQENSVRKNQGNFSSNNTFILNEPEMKELADFCNESLKNYFYKIYNVEKRIKVKITQSWLNWTKKNEYHHGHEHPNSVVSGVFYFNAEKGKDRICFQKNLYQQIKLPYSETNDYNNEQVELLIETGDLILFPSYIIHYVPFNITENRVSLAFNSFVEGELGNIEMLNYLKI